MTMTVQEKFSKTREEMNAALIERDQEIDLCLTAIVAQEHVLLVGQPGTAKSLLADTLVNWLHGSKFQVLLTKFSTPEDVFGPISVQGLKQDVYKRITTGKMPEATVAFVDEVFKASSAILNTLLQVLNERTFRNDSMLMQCPLLLCIGASNEWPSGEMGGKELNALFDRFLLRKPVRAIGSERSMSRLLWSSDQGLTPQLSTTITPAEVHTATAEARALQWNLEAQKAFGDIHKQAKHEGIMPGDRRLRKAVKAVQAYAWLNGATEVETDHLEILAHLLWDDPVEQPKKLNQIIHDVAQPVGMQVNTFMLEIEQILQEDTKELAKAASATKKLGEIEKQLKKLSGEKASNLLSYVREQIQGIRKSAMGGIGN